MKFDTVRSISNFFLAKIYYLFWLVLHFVYRCQENLREQIQVNYRQIIRRLFSCLPAYSYHGELVNLIKSVEKFQKIPKHLAISVIDSGSSDPSYRDAIDLQMLARVISWAWVARIPVISVYDYHGHLKTSYRELGCYVQEELIQNFWALKKYGRANEPPCVKFHNVPKINGYSNGVGSNGFKVSNPLHIAVFSHEDGKAEILRTAKRIYFDHVQLKTDSNEEKTEESEENKMSLESLNEEKFDLILNENNSWLHSSGGAKTDPDLLLILGSIKSTLGFLPWHIRLTEIHWLPKLPLVESRDFLAALKKFSRCEQRFGT